MLEELENRIREFLKLPQNEDVKLNDVIKYIQDNRLCYVSTMGLTNTFGFYTKSDFCQGSWNLKKNLLKEQNEKVIKFLNSL